MSAFAPLSAAQQRTKVPIPAPILRRPLVRERVGSSMRDIPTAGVWRGGLLYAAMSLLVVWHTLAMLVTAAPDNVMTRAARTLFDPYLTLFNLHVYWGFFAPTVGTAYQFRYVVEDASGQQHLFIPIDKLSRFSPSWIWLGDRYRDVMDSVDTFGEVTVAELCREHAALHPVAITLLAVEGKEFTPEARRAGKGPLDPEFVTVETLKTIRCPAQ
jgi:hypothetical protein